MPTFSNADRPRLMEHSCVSPDRKRGTLENTRYATHVQCRMTFHQCILLMNVYRDHGGYSTLFFPSH